MNIEVFNTPEQRETIAQQMEAISKHALLAARRAREADANLFSAHFMTAFTYMEGLTTSLRQRSIN